LTSDELTDALERRPIADAQRFITYLRDKFMAMQGQHAVMLPPSPHDV